MKRILGVVGAVVALGYAGCGSSSTPAESPIDGGADDSTTDASEPDTGGDATASVPDGAVGAEASTSFDAAVDAETGVPAVPTPAPDFIWYVLDEATGTTAHDSSSHHFDISVPGITWNAGGIFDGATSCGGTTVGPEYRSPPITISAWLTPAARTDQPTGYSLAPFPPNALSDDVPGVGGYGIGLNVWGTGSALAAEAVSPCTTAGLCVANGTQNAAAADAGDGGLSCTSVSSCNQGFDAGKEYLVTVTVDAPPDGGTTPIAQVYVNGVLFDQDTAVIPPANAAPPIYLGCHNMDTGYGTARFFDGRIRDVRVYLRQLAATEVGQLYANGPTLHAPPLSDAGSSDAAPE